MSEDRLEEALRQMKQEDVDAGAASVAVISDVLVTGDPAARVASFLAELRD